MVCGPCHRTLGGSPLNVGSTGEFRTLSPEMVAAAMAAEPGDRPQAKGTCSWCAKPEAGVKKLIGRGGTALCDECVALACDIMEAELGSDWR